MEFMTSRHPSHNFGGQKDVMLTVSGRAATTRYQVSPTRPSNRADRPIRHGADACERRHRLAQAWTRRALSSSLEVIAYGMIGLSVVSMLGTAIRRRRES